jgi:hypothetical protein
LDGWLAELNGAPEQAREIYQHGQDTADTRSPVYTARLLLAHGRLLRRTGNIYAKCALQGRGQLRRFVEQWNQPITA